MSMPHECRCEVCGLSISPQALIDDAPTTFPDDIVHRLRNHGRAAELWPHGVGEGERKEIALKQRAADTIEQLGLRLDEARIAIGECVTALSVIDRTRQEPQCDAEHAAVEELRRVIRIGQQALTAQEKFR